MPSKSLRVHEMPTGPPKVDNCPRTKPRSPFRQASWKLYHSLGIFHALSCLSQPYFLAFWYEMELGGAYCAPWIRQRWLLTVLLYSDQIYSLDEHDLYWNILFSWCRWENAINFESERATRWRTKDRRRKTSKGQPDQWRHQWHQPQRKIRQQMNKSSENVYKMFTNVAINEEFHRKTG